jgi:hypothetical protein
VYKLIVFDDKNWSICTPKNKMAYNVQDWAE